MAPSRKTSSGSAQLAVVHFDPQNEAFWSGVGSERAGAYPLCLGRCGSWCVGQAQQWVFAPQFWDCGVLAFPLAEPDPVAR